MSNDQSVVTQIINQIGRLKLQPIRCRLWVTRAHPYREIRAEWIKIDKKLLKDAADQGIVLLENKINITPANRTVGSWLHRVEMLFFDVLQKFVCTSLYPLVF